MTWWQWAGVVFVSGYILYEAASRVAAAIREVAAAQGRTSDALEALRREVVRLTTATRHSEEWKRLNDAPDRGQIADYRELLDEQD